jgi:hypothetical protein
LSQLRLSQTQLLQFITETKEKIVSLSAEVQLKVIILFQLGFMKSILFHFQVSTEFAEEVRRLESVIDGFQKPFSDSPAYLPMYKEVRCSVFTLLITLRNDEKYLGTSRIHRRDCQKRIGHTLHRWLIGENSWHGKGNGL